MKIRLFKKLQRSGYKVRHIDFCPGLWFFQREENKGNERQRESVYFIRNSSHIIFKFRRIWRVYMKPKATLLALPRRYSLFYQPKQPSHSREDMTRRSEEWVGTWNTELHCDRRRFKLNWNLASLWDSGSVKKTNLL